MKRKLLWLFIAGIAVGIVTTDIVLVKGIA